MSSHDDPDLRADSLSHESSTYPPPALGASRAGETSAERRIRLLRTVLGDLGQRPDE